MYLLGRFFPLIGMAACCLLGLSACSDSSSSRTATADTAKGVFIDSAVEGLTYTSGGVTGLTDIDGTYEYEVGQTVTFTLGGISLGTVVGQALVTPRDLVPEDATNPEQYATNIARLLVSVDNDGDPSNGIEVTEEMLIIFEEQAPTIDFDVPADDFATPEVTEFLAALDVVTTGLTGELITTEEAEEHLDESIAALTDGAQALPLGASPRVIGTSTETNEVVTDGTWTAWTARPVSLLLNNGSETVDLSTYLDPSIKLVQSDQAILKFDGRYAVFAADNIIDDKGPQIYYVDTAAEQPVLVQVTNYPAGEGLPFRETEVLLDDGLIVWFALQSIDMDDIRNLAMLVEPEPTISVTVSYYDIAAETPTIIDVDFPENSYFGSEIVTTDKSLFWLNSAKEEEADGEIWYLDTKAETPTVTQLTSDGFPKQDLTANDGLIAWVFGGTPDLEIRSVALEEQPEADIVCYASATDLVIKQASALLDLDPKFDVTIGNGYIAWSSEREEGMVVGYHAVTDAEKTAAEFALNSTPDDLCIGNGVFAWIDGSDVYAFTIGAEAPVLLGESNLYNSRSFNGEYVHIAETTVFWAKDLKEERPYVYKDPSMYLMKFDTATDSEASKVNATDYQRIFAPAVANGQVVWISKSANWNIYAQKTTDPQAPIMITPATMNAHMPIIDDGILVFNGYDRTQMVGMTEEAYLGDEEYYREIYSCDLNSDSRTVTNISNNELDDEKAQIDGDIIVWQTDDYEAFFYNRLTETTTALETYDSSDSVNVTGNYIFWRDSADLHLYNTSTETETILSTPGNITKCPTLAGQILTWIGYNSENNYSIFYFDMDNVTAEAPAESIVELASAVDYDQRPLTDGRFISWGGNQHGGDSPIYYYDLQATEPAIITIGGDATEGDIYSEVCNPRLDNGLIVFAAEAYKSLGEENGDKELFYFDLLAETPTLTQLTDNELWDSRPEVKDGVIIWRTGGGNWMWDGKITAAARPMR